ncbi:MAG: hypothetical protein ACYDHW_06870 [Syntrophorhabdaceae bacterium]
MGYRLILITFATVILFITGVDLSFSQVNFLPCYNMQCQEGYTAVEQYDRSCKCVPVDAPPKCDTTVCGIGYKPVMQSNGSCMCVVEDCTNESGCFDPPKVPDDCPSIEGCNPPQVIQP